MKNLLERYLPVRNTDGGGGGGGGAAAAAAAGGGVPASAGGAGAGAAAGAGGGSDDAAAAAAAAAAAGAGPYRPNGLPDTMFGKDDRETIDKMHTALNGYRQRDASVPDKVEAYNSFDVDKAPEAIKPFIAQLSNDPLYAAAAKVAIEEKIPVGAMQKMTMALYEAGAQAGILEAPLDVAAERAALLPETAKNMSQADQDKAIDARMLANEDFVKLMVSNGKLDQKAADHTLLMLMDSAHGNQFLEAVAKMATGSDRAQPLNGDGGAGGAGQGQREALRAQLAAPEMNPQHPNFDRAKFDALDQQYQRLIGN
ncbi:hypothetical protein GGQ99_000967 [Aminobacter niigataensis]|uniref:Uncharacterized protein n=1 Tax=Aminobacter niigataensis TaxID=83265 RepID=A0ABR6KZM8_9HYPH|nr:hypothetical protein [Aminobacter niigataensis]MBB4649245.1 hypothetical protein [Aminobacter niigataensis]